MWDYSESLKQLQNYQINLFTELYLEINYKESWNTLIKLENNPCPLCYLMKWRRDLSLLTVHRFICPDWANHEKGTQRAGLPDDLSWHGYITYLFASKCLHMNTQTHRKAGWKRSRDTILYGSLFYTHSGSSVKVLLAFCLFLDGPQRHSMTDRLTSVCATYPWCVKHENLQTAVVKYSMSFWNLWLPNFWCNAVSQSPRSPTTCSFPAVTLLQSHIGFVTVRY